MRRDEPKRIVKKNLIVIIKSVTAVKRKHRSRETLLEHPGRAVFFFFFIIQLITTFLLGFSNSGAHGGGGDGYCARRVMHDIRRRAMT